MTLPPAVWLRAGLIFYLGVELLIGAWAAAWPRSFYDDFPWPGHPWVGPLPSYNEHLIRDFGGMNLALAVVFGVAAATLDQRLARTVLVAYLVFAVPHLAFHLGHTEPFETVDAIAQTAAVVALAALPPLLLALIGRGDNRAHPASSRRQPP